MKILVACEESQAVCKEFRALGHEAYSCDIQECSGDHPEWHLQGDVLAYIYPEETESGFYSYDAVTQDGSIVNIPLAWDMIIAFPPCTYLSNAGAARLYPSKGVLDEERYAKGLMAKDFFMKFYNAPCDKIAIENPVASGIYDLPQYDQIIQPYEFGHPYSKKTCLWLKGLPELQPTNIIRKDIISWVSGGSKDKNGNPRKQSGTKIRDAKTRSKTFIGIAKAMADQWGNKNTKTPQQITLF